MIVFTLFAAVILQLFVYPCLSDLTTDRPVSLERDTAVFPTSLTLIENEAFEGTVFSTLVFQNGLISISEHAFSNTNQLKDAYIPSSAEYISDSAFYNSTIGTVFGINGTYAQGWAKRHGLKFAHRDYWAVSPRAMRFGAAVVFALSGFVCPLPGGDARKIRQYVKRIIVSMRPQDRPELNPIDYKFP